MRCREKFFQMGTQGGICVFDKVKILFKSSETKKKVTLMSFGDALSLNT